MVNNKKAVNDSFIDRFFMHFLITLLTQSLAIMTINIGIHHS